MKITIERERKRVLPVYSDRRRALPARTPRGESTGEGTREKGGHQAVSRGGRCLERYLTFLQEEKGWSSRREREGERTQIRRPHSRAGEKKKPASLFHRKKDGRPCRA